MFARLRAFLSPPLSNLTPIVVHYLHPDGSEAMPPDTMTLEDYVQSPDLATRQELTRLEAAIEADIHRGDGKWTLTHKECER